MTESKPTGPAEFLNPLPICASPPPDEDRSYHNGAAVGVVLSTTGPAHTDGCAATFNKDDACSSFRPETEIGDADQCPDCRCAPGHPHATGCPAMEYVPVGHLDSVDTRHHAEQAEDARAWVDHEDASENVLSDEYAYIPRTGAMLVVVDNPLMDSMAETFDRCLLLAAAKNADYTAGADPFANFDRAAIVGCEPLRGLLVRMIDKVSRAGALVDADPHVAGESLADTFDDLVNYAAIGRAMLERDR